MRVMVQHRISQLNLIVDENRRRRLALLAQKEAKKKASDDHAEILAGLGKLGAASEELLKIETEL